MLLSGWDRWPAGPVTPTGRNPSAGGDFYDWFCAATTDGWPSPLVGDAMDRGTTGRHALAAANVEGPRCAATANTIASEPAVARSLSRSTSRSGPGRPAISLPPCSTLPDRRPSTGFGSSYWSSAGQVPARCWFAPRRLDVAWPIRRRFAGRRPESDLRATFGHLQPSARLADGLYRRRFANATCDAACGFAQLGEDGLWPAAGDVS